MCIVERIHNEPLCDPLYCPGAANAFSYKTLQASRWEHELVDYSRRLEEVALVGRAGICCGRFECFRSLLVRHCVFSARRVQGVSLAILLAADPAPRLDA
jgi:hypothetical protein